ncbi:MAG TPA: glutathione S-transferase family protein [Phenylobacterium sp.]|jgi:glutathione S-transferase|uniref:glutathione S-transferase family protein n=1 Tax=Phenylobacterium sp. TaxID=1871053 RepID=UPI002D5FAEC0|nr:glutathione S-transferase family protein [Phenylobacterium sp.]HZZ69841.1 glutathione S-transferase family protein [Phenylobacterium sp.]
MLKLFHAWGSCSLASLIALEEAGADYELAVMNTKAWDQRKPDYLAINPKSRVPALVTDRGVLTETPAILAWVAQTWPRARLAPLDDPFAFAEAQAFNSYLCATVHVTHSHKHRGYRWTDDADAQAAMTRQVPQNEIACFRLIEDQMFQGPWVLGDTYSICDGYLFTLFGWLPGDGVDTGQFPRLAEHSERVAARPAVRKVLAQQPV